MRKLIFTINMTLDGCVDHTKTAGGDEILEYYTQLIREAGLFIYGRKTYQLMVPYWPEVVRNQSGTKAAIEFARTFESVHKVVFSRSLEGVEDKKTRIVHGNLHDEIVKLKQENGKDILVGGVDVASQLVELGLVDEYHLVFQPIVAGEGRRLFDHVKLPERVQLKLSESKFLRSGCVALRYSKQ